MALVGNATLSIPHLPRLVCPHGRHEPIPVWVQFVKTSVQMRLQCLESTSNSGTNRPEVESRATETKRMRETEPANGLSTIGYFAFAGTSRLSAYRASLPLRHARPPAKSMDGSDAGHRTWKQRRVSGGHSWIVRLRSGRGLENWFAQELQITQGPHCLCTPITQRAKALPEASTPFASILARCRPEREARVSMESYRSSFPANSSHVQTPSACPVWRSLPATLPLGPTKEPGANLPETSQEMSYRRCRKVDRVPLY